MPSNHLILCQPLLLHLQSFPASRSFQMSQFFTSGGQSIGVSASTSVLPMNIQDWSPLGWTHWISLQSKGLSRVLQHHSSKASILQLSPFFVVQLTHPYRTTGKTIALTRWTFVGKVMSLLFNMLSRLVITFLPRSKHLLISWRQSPPAVILEPPPKKFCHCFHCFPYAEYLMWNARLDEAQTGIKIARRNINNRIYCRWHYPNGRKQRGIKEPLWWRWKRKGKKSGIQKCNIKKPKIMASIPITSWKIDVEKMEMVTDFIFLGSKVATDGDWSHEIKRHLLLV